VVLGRVDPRRLLRAVLDGENEHGGRDRGAGAVRDQIAERFHSMACRAAVMSGDRLDDGEIQALLEEAAGLEHPHNCPHGRPTVLTFGVAELERYFRRRC
jgi:DNA mismatch repair protein MutL